VRELAPGPIPRSLPPATRPSFNRGGAARLRSPGMTGTMRTECEQVSRWSAAIRDYDPLEPWLTESAQDEDYWHDVAQVVVASLGAWDGEAVAVAALRAAIAARFPSVELESENGFFRDNLDELLRRIAAQALS
jgi:hypothetical protein